MNYSILCRANSKGRVLVEARRCESVDPPNWTYEVNLGDEVIETEGWYESKSAAIDAGRVWALKEGYSPMWIDDPETHQGG